jgi:hypothetical protein
VTRLADAVQEMRELGLARTAFRVRYELGVRMHSALRAVVPEPLPSTEAVRVRPIETVVSASPFMPPPSPSRLRGLMRDENARALRGIAERATQGIVRAFGRWDANYGDPIDWHLDPTTGERWPREVPWSSALRDAGRIGDVKMAWEAARFPQAFHLARAAALAPERAAEFGSALEQQIRSFIANNPFGRGIHWYSSQEIALRLLSWTFALGTFVQLGVDLQSLAEVLTRYVYRSIVHIDREAGLAEHAIYNNHLVAESLGLFLGAELIDCPERERWSADGLRRLTEQSDRQFYEDGASLQHAHNYHRASLTHYLCARGILARSGRQVPPQWVAAMERSLDFLFAHQNEADGTLPNFGANDGSMPAIVSTCAFGDFRPLLQTLSVVTRGERLYDRGPWDEALLWWCGEGALDAPLRARPRTSISFPASGYHVLRAKDPSTFATFRCGSLRDRFSQIDMLHVDMFDRGENMLIDGGSFLYNGDAEWNAYFSGTASHNTVMVDGVDQMLHYRRFKYLYWTRAETLAFSAESGFVEGEHYGYQRLPHPCVHRRRVTMLADGVCIVRDRLEGDGEHRARLHWLCGDFPYEYAGGALDLRTRHGLFRVAVFDGAGRPLMGDVVRGRESPPRGWSARHYGERTATPSLAVETTGRGIVMITVAGRAGDDFARIAREHLS